MYYINYTTKETIKKKCINLRLIGKNFIPEKRELFCVVGQVKERKRKRLFECNLRIYILLLCFRII